MALKSYKNKITALKWSANIQFVLIIGFLIACIAQIGGAMGGTNTDYFKAFLFDAFQAVLSMNLSAAAVSGRKLGIRRTVFWILVIISITFNIYYKWAAIDPAAGFKWEDLDKLSGFDLYIPLASNIILGLAIAIITETRNDTLLDIKFLEKEEDRLERNRAKRAAARVIEGMDQLTSGKG
jgi:hypothetical protein